MNKKCVLCKEQAKMIHIGVYGAYWYMCLECNARRIFSKINK